MDLLRELRRRYRMAFLLGARGSALLRARALDVGALASDGLQAFRREV